MTSWPSSGRLTKMATLYRTTILPQAEQSVDAARVGYRAGKAGFLELIDAQRAWRGISA